MLVDLVLVLWDLFGYNNMFLCEFFDDMLCMFLIVYFESFDNIMFREIIEFMFEFFLEMVEMDDDVMFEFLFYLLDYVVFLEVNFDG